MSNIFFQGGRQNFLGGAPLVTGLVGENLEVN